VRRLLGGEKNRRFRKPHSRKERTSREKKKKEKRSCWKKEGIRVGGAGTKGPWRPRKDPTKKESQKKDLVTIITTIHQKQGSMGDEIKKKDESHPPERHQWGAGLVSNKTRKKYECTTKGKNLKGVRAKGSGTGPGPIPQGGVFFGKKKKPVTHKNHFQVESSKKGGRPAGKQNRERETSHEGKGPQSKIRRGDVRGSQKCSKTPGAKSTRWQQVPQEGEKNHGTSRGGKILRDASEGRGNI